MITHFRCDMRIEAAPADVLRMVAEIEQWRALFPHVRRAQPLDRRRWRLTLLWRSLPFTVIAAQRVSPDSRSVEQRFAARFGPRVACRWTVTELPGECSSVSLEIHVERGPALAGWLTTRFVAPDLARESLAMIALLTESDRKAHRERS